MKKISFAVLLTLIILLLSLTSSVDFINIQSTEALSVGIQWGYLNPYNGTEKYYESYICDFIRTRFAQQGASWGYQNLYWDYTTLEALYQTTQWEHLYCDFAANWWVGDYHASMSQDPLPFGHLYCYGNSGSDIPDYTVYQFTNFYHVYMPPFYDYWVSDPSRQYFNFIWTCVNGGFYWTDSSGNWDDIIGIIHPITGYPPPPSPPPPPPTNTNTQYGFWDYDSGAVGMPYGWTGTTTMSSDGSYCYIGFEANSPFMGDRMPNSVYYFNFPYRFYDHALSVIHFPIWACLEYASWSTYQTSFANSEMNTGYWRYVTGEGMEGWYQCRMRVLGNNQISLPT